MFNLKKIFDITKKSVSVMLSTVLCLNLCSFFASADGPVTIFPVIIIGNAASGKTKLTKALCDDKKFNSEYKPTIGMDFSTMTIRDSDNIPKYELQLWDTSGNERLQTIIPLDLKGKNMVLLAVSCDSNTPNEDLEKWLGFLKTHNNKALVKVVLTKTDIFSDKENEIKAIKEKIENYLRNLEEGKLKFKVDKEVIVTSAKDGTGIDDLNEFMIGFAKEKIVTKREQKKPSSVSNDDSAPANRVGEDKTTSEPKFRAKPKPSHRGRRLTNKQIAGIGAGGAAAVIGLGVVAAVLINNLTHNHK